MGQGVPYPGPGWGGIVLGQGTVYPVLITARGYPVLVLAGERLGRGRAGGTLS